MDKQARNAMDCFFFLWGISKVYVKMALVLNIPVGNFAVLLKSVLLTPKLPKVKLPSPFFSGPFYPQNCQVHLTKSKIISCFRDCSCHLLTICFIYF